MPQATLLVLGQHAKRAPEIDPGARLGESDGGNALVVFAVELVAVAPESRFAKGVNLHINTRAVQARTLL